MFTSYRVQALPAGHCVEVRSTTCGPFDGALIGVAFCGDGGWRAWRVAYPVASMMRLVGEDLTTADEAVQAIMENRPDATRAR